MQISGDKTSPFSRSRCSPSSSPGPIYYQWKSSLPREVLSRKAVRRKVGALGARTTLDFLQETQGYIKKITGNREIRTSQALKGRFRLNMCGQRQRQVGKYWSLSQKDIQNYKARTQVVYRSPLHLLSPKSSNSHVCISWGDELA